MPALGQRIKGYRFTSEDRLFFDTNVWLLIFGTINEPGDTRVRTYSNALKRARDAGARIEVDGVVLGEFINRCLRDYYNLLRELGEVNTDYKRYRATQEYADSVQGVVRATKSILSYCDRVEGVFARCDIGTLLDGFGNRSSDWSDELIVALCHERSLTLVTDDGDFLESGLPILTRNPVYFSSRGE